MSQEHASGRAFEQRVAEIYCLLGYEVQRDLTVCGQQVDMLLTYRLPGAMPVRTIVECKWRSEGSISNDVVNDIAGVLANAHNSGQADQAIIITNRTFTRQAKEASLSSRIQLVTYSDLMVNLVDFSSYLTRLIYEYEHFDEIAGAGRSFMIEVTGRCDLHKYYTPLKATTGGVNTFDLQEHVMDWITATNRRNHVAILGDYGTGKSSFCLSFAYTLAKAHAESPQTGRIPLFISLREYGKAISMEQLITDLLINRYDVRIANFALFRRLLDAGMLVLIFDGFDEMATKASKRVTSENFRRLYELGGASSKSIITCRTHYFKTRLEERRIFSEGRLSGTIMPSEMRPAFDIVYLREFDQPQIRDFLKKHTQDWKRVQDLIDTTYNLKDLARRPILLEMILKTAASLRGRARVNIADLYRFYTDLWIEREDWHSAMTPEGKRAFMESLASTMYQKRPSKDEDYQIHYTKLPAPIKEHFKDEITSPEDLDFYDHDTRTCSFLNRDDSGNYRFIHKSFMEFFVACSLLRYYRARGVAPLKPSESVSKEVVDFMVPQLASERDRDRLLASVFMTNGWCSMDKIVEETPEYAGVFTTLLEHKESAGPDRAKAAYYLRRAGCSNHVPLLIKVVANDSYLYARDMACVALSEIGGAAVVEPLTSISASTLCPISTRKSIAAAIATVKTKGGGAL